MTFNKTLIEAPTVEAIRASVSDWEIMLVTILRAIVDRYERQPNYPFINTKLNLITGKDVEPGPDKERDFKGSDAIYGWIQGRGLEALVGHARWLPRCRVLKDAEQAELLQRVTNMIERVAENLSTLSSKNGGHLYFVMTPDGRPFDMDGQGKRRFILPDHSQSTLTDLFYVKGQFAAASFLRDAKTQTAACARFRQIAADLKENRFRTDQIAFDPLNKVTPIPGRFTHGPRMIALGACSLLYAANHETEWADLGMELIEYTLQKHIALEPRDGLQAFDMHEYIDSAGKPWLDDGRSISDPGHATEFSGFAAKLLLLLDQNPEKSGKVKSMLEKARRVLPAVIEKNFRNGFNSQTGGICKTYDLIARKTVNSDTPWWNLPETIRAAAAVARLGPDLNRPVMLNIIRECSNGFFKSFVNERAHLMAYQNLNVRGDPVEIIPATPDADPGYHTGLSIIDFLDYLREL